MPWPCGSGPPACVGRGPRGRRRRCLIDLPWPAEVRTTGGGGLRVVVDAGSEAGARTGFRPHASSRAIRSPIHWQARPAFSDGWPLLPGRSRLHPVHPAASWIHPRRCCSVPPAGMHTSESDRAGSHPRVVERPVGIATNSGMTARDRSLGAAGLSPCVLRMSSGVETGPRQAGGRVRHSCSGTPAR